MLPGVQVNGKYYRDNLLANKLLPDIFQTSQGVVSSFNRAVHWRIEHETPSLSWSKRCPTSFLQRCIAAEFTGSDPVDYSIWRVLQEKVSRSRIANVNEL